MVVKRLESISDVEKLDSGSCVDQFAFSAMIDLYRERVANSDIRHPWIWAMQLADDRPLRKALRGKRPTACLVLQLTEGDARLTSCPTAFSVRITIGEQQHTYVTDDRYISAIAATRPKRDANGVRNTLTAADVPKAGTGVCAACGKRPQKMKICDACRAFGYCDKSCQDAHWNSGHKQACKQICKGFVRKVRD